MIPPPPTPSCLRNDVAHTYASLGLSAYTGNGNVYSGGMADVVRGLGGCSLRVKGGRGIVAALCDYSTCFINQQQQRHVRSLDAGALRPSALRRPHCLALRLVCDQHLRPRHRRGEPLPKICCPFFLSANREKTFAASPLLKSADFFSLCLPPKSAGQVPGGGAARQPLVGRAFLRWTFFFAAMHF